MTIDRFTQEEFEAFLLTTDLEIADSELSSGEWVYKLAVNGKAIIKIRSSIAEDGIAKDTAADSIRLHLEDTTGRYLTKMDQSYVTRVSGWQDRLTLKIGELIGFRMAAGDCQKCHKPLQIFLSQTERNPNRRFAKCADCASFFWLDQYTPQFFDDHQSVASAVKEDILKGLSKLANEDDLDNLLLDNAPAQLGAGKGVSLDDFLDLSPDQPSLLQGPVIVEDRQPNPEQLTVIEADLDRPCRVLAGPGSGKTFSMALRYLYMVNHDVPPERIVAITFTSKMAQELLSRIKTRYPVEGDAERQICTIHAFCRRLLISTEQVSGSVQVPGSSDETGKSNEWGWKMRKFLEETLIEVFPNEEMRPLWGETLEWINTSKAHGIRPKDCYAFFLEYFDESYYAKKVTIVREKLDKWYSDNTLLPFVDMVYKVDILLQDDPGFLNYCKRKFSHIILDEAQDTNEQAVRIIKAIAGDRVTFVGDIDQLLFRFNGATPEANLLDGFEKNYPNGQLLFLGVNYRSAQEIVKGSRMILNNYDQRNGPYPISAYNPISAIRSDKASFEFGSFKDPMEEAEEVARIISDHITAKGLPSAEDVFIGMRTRAYSVYYEDALSRAKVPYINTTGMTFWLLNHIEKLVSYIRIAADFKSQAFGKIYNIPSKDWTCPWKSMDQYKQYMPSRMLSREFLTRYPTWDAALNALSYGRLEKKWYYGVKDIEDVISEVASCQSSKEAVRYLIDNVFKAYLTFDSGRGSDQEADGGRLDDLSAVEEIAGLYSSFKDFLTYVDNLIQAAKAASQDDWSGRTVISTIHKLKGLERPIVFAVGVCEAPSDAEYMNSLLPHTFTFMSPPNEGKLPAGGLGRMEDERCLYYVLITRAKDAVYVFNPLQYRAKEQVASRFIHETKVALEE